MRYNWQWDNIKTAGERHHYSLPFNINTSAKDTKKLFESLFTLLSFVPESVNQPYNKYIWDIEFFSLRTIFKWIVKFSFGLEFS